MAQVIMEQPLRRRISSNPRPSGSAFAYLLIVLLSAFGIASVAYGFSVLTGLPFLIGLIVAVILYSTKMYFIRHQPLQEQMMSSGWDRVVGYLVTAFFFIALAAYGLYEFSLVKIAALETRQSIQSQLRAQLREPADPTIGPPPDNSESSGEERERLEPPMRAASPKDASIGGSINGLEGFIKATLGQSNNAVGCWLALGLMEVFIRILMRHNRPRYYYDWE
jgi:hypothetical protein